jgi:dipeptidase D
VDIVAPVDDELYEGLQPPELWRHFRALNAIPRASGNERAAREYAQSVVEAAAGEWTVDQRGNAVARIPGSLAGPVVAVQAHLDMVCESAPTVAFDCLTDPIVPRREGDVVYATGTTLGADNGIGVAAALALVSEPDLTHGPLELLFTVEEETGLHGALGLDIGLLSAELLVNLDSEDDRALTVGCAGGAELVLELPFTPEPAPSGWKSIELRVSGLTGGHSGMQIAERHASAIVLLVALLDELRTSGVKTRLASIDGGSAHNAIPREATARLLVASEIATALAPRIEQLYDSWRADEPELAIELLDSKPIDSVLAPATASSLLSLLAQLPHGVLAMSADFDDTIATSANLALVASEQERVEIVTSIRGLEQASLDALGERIAALATEAGAGARTVSGYPGWEPRPGSALLQLAEGAYRSVYGHDPRVVVVHGGLECGAIVAKKPELDAISFGPLIEDPHTPTEHVYAHSVSETWDVLLALLVSVAS